MKSYAEIDSLFNVELDLVLTWNTNEVNYFTAATSWIYKLFFHSNNTPNENYFGALTKEGLFTYVCWPMISTIFIPITDVSETLVFIQHCTRKFKTTNFFCSAIQTWTKATRRWNQKC